MAEVDAPAQSEAIHNRTPPDRYLHSIPLGNGRRPATSITTPILCMSRCAIGASRP
jgi:hypothetical protein